MNKFDPVIKDFPHLLHGADYNPDQWKNYPEVLREDLVLFDKAYANTASIAIFSWEELEPEDGVYNFEFFDKIMDDMAAHGMKACFATPSAGKPHWLGVKYPDILSGGKRGGRGGFCKSSPTFRRKISELNEALAKHYKGHPALGLWHISNECCGECTCDRCMGLFRDWLKEKYQTLDNINAAYWNAFWGHTYISWDEIVLDNSVHALMLDWYRFTNELLADYIKVEADALKKYTPDIPVTTNMMETPGIDYKKVADVIDIVSWDSYPNWHAPDGGHMYAAVKTAFWHDRFRCMKQKPFLLMESTPSLPSWQNINKLKKPGMHKLASLQAVAHGSDSVQYFQWRKSRGGFEKFHGAVVDHYGKENRVFNEVADTGLALSKLDEVVGTKNISRAAIIYDIDSHTALEKMAGARKPKEYEDLCLKFYRALWKRGISCDVIETTHDLNNYDLVIAPALYMTSKTTINKLESFVIAGGTLVSTYLTGWVDENDLCYLGGFPGGKLADVFGIWAEELDCLFDGESNTAKITAGELSGKSYTVEKYCDLIHAKTASVLGEFGSDFFAGRPALTVNNYGKGCAYYIAFRNSGNFMDDLIDKLANKLGLPRAINTVFPEGVTASVRTDGENDFVFVQNFADKKETIALDEEYFDMLDGKNISGKLDIDAYGIKVLKRTTK